MEILKVSANVREDVTKPAKKKIRKDGYITSILYGGEGGSVPLMLAEKEWARIFEDHGAGNLILDLVIDKQKGEPELIKVGEIQRHPTKGKIMHVDLKRLARGVVATFEVPIKLVGKSQGEKNGGILTQQLDDIEVECMPRDVPDQIEIEITKYVIGDTMHVSDLVYDNPNVKITDDAHKLIFHIEMPRIIEVAVTEEEGEEVEGEEVEVEEETETKKPEAKPKKEKK
jgi:large subunit ribosomal protein L25